MYKQKYEKYKLKYLKLKNSQKGGDMYDDETEDINVENILDEPPMELDNSLPKIDVVEEENDDVVPLVTEKIVTYTPIHPFDLINAKWVDKLKISDDKFVTLKEQFEDKLYLSINTLDDFDQFTDIYGELFSFNDVDPVYGQQDIVRIRWDNLSKKYKGIYVNPGLGEERFETVFYKDKYYPSWWKNELKFLDNGVLKFQRL